MHRFIVAAILQQLKLIIQVVYPTESYGFFFGGGGNTFIYMEEFAHQRPESAGNKSFQGW